MRFIKFLMAMFLIFSVMGFGLYYFGTQIASEKVVEVVAAEVERNGKFDEFKELLEQDADIQPYIGGTPTQTDQLPFTTKEEATRTIIQKVGLQTIQEFQSKWQDGLSEQDIQEMLSELDGTFSEDELRALKIIAYHEFFK